MKRLSVPLAAVVLLIAACTSSEKKLAEHNEADVSFVQEVFAHNKRGLQLVELGLEHADTTDAKEVASRVKKKIEEENKTLEELMKHWHVEPGHHHPEKLPEEKVKKLEETHGTAFDKLFLEELVEHHREGLPAAEKEVEEGKNEEATKLAGELVRGLPKEISLARQVIIGL